MTKNELVALAFEAMKDSYCVYSKFPVGAAVLCKDGVTFKGVNIENASYGLTNCAERSAVFAAYSNGYRREDIEALAIVSNGKRISAPCGACRQVLNELIGKDTPIYLSNGKEEVTKTMRELLPMAFDEEDVL